MSLGLGWNDPLAIGGLWYLRYKINGPYKGFNLKLNVAEALESKAKDVCNDIGAKMLTILPADAEIFFAAVSKDDTGKDSRFCPDACGIGLAQIGAGPPIVPEYTDAEETALKVRFESLGPNPISLKFPCLPDSRVEKTRLLNAMASVTARPGANPVTPVAFVAWEANFTTLLASIVYQCHHVRAGHTPGGPYTYFEFQAAYPFPKVSKKKGGRDFS